MMDTRIWIALCFLLLFNLGSAEHDDDHGGQEAPEAPAVPGSGLNAAPESRPGGQEAPEAPAVPGSGLNPPHGPTAPSLLTSDPSSTSSLSNITTTEEETITVTPVPKKVNGTSISTSEAVVPSDQSTSQPQIPQSSSHAPTFHTSTTSTTSTLPHTTPPASATTTPTAETTHPTALPDSGPPSNGTLHHGTNSSISVTPPQPPSPETSTSTTSTSTSTTTTFTTTPAATVLLVQSSSTSSSSQKPSSSESTTLSSPQSTSQSDRDPKASNRSTISPPTNRSTISPPTSRSTISPPTSRSTISPPTSPATQTKAHADSPSQLNVGGGPTMVHESPTLDPLLAGLVSAFIITAVIITLLLFLKLRRRDNRPEFRRLQDLPMDDMMEDTPLSMYSY